jgi:hypothetical protein
MRRRMQRSYPLSIAIAASCTFPPKAHLYCCRVRPKAEAFGELYRAGSLFQSASRFGAKARVRY